MLITYLHLFSEYFLLEGACLCTSGYTLHPYRENSFLVGACPRTFGCTLHPYRENSFLVGACPNISDFALHPYRNNLFLVGAYTNILIFPSIYFSIFSGLMESFCLRCINRYIDSVRIPERMVSASPGFNSTAFGSTPALDQRPC